MQAALVAFCSLVMACTAFGQTYTIRTIAGGGWPDKIPGLSVGLLDGSGLASDRNGNVYFSTRAFVLRLDSAGNLSRIAGDGVCRYDGDSGPAAAAGLCDISSIAVDASGNLYIADSGNNVVRRISNGIINTVAGSGVDGYKGDNGPASSAQLSNLSGLAVDAAGNIYISDSSHRVVRKVSNGIITTVAGGGISFGDGGPATSAALYFPQGLAVDSGGNLYIVDNYDQVVRKVSNGIIRTIAGTPYIGGVDRDNVSATTVALCASGVAVDSGGNVYITEEARSRIRKVSAGIITTIAGTGVQGHSGDGAPATSAQLGMPRVLTVGATGELYIADGLAHYPGTWIRKISNGIITTVAGNGLNETSGDCTDIFGADDNGSASNALFCNPAGIAVNASGNVYVADVSFQVIREISNGVIRTVAGNWREEAEPVIENVPATRTSLVLPWGVAVDAYGNIYDTDNGRVRKVSNGTITTVAGGGTAPGDNIPATSVDLDDPEGIAVDTAGNIYFTEGNTVRKVAGGIITTIAGNGAAGYGGDDGVSTAAQLDYPSGVAVDGQGNVYVADSANSRIRKVSKGIITTIAGNGTAGHGGDNGPAVAAQLNNPGGVAVDANGDIFVADTGNSRIRKISNGAITTIAGSVTAGYGGDGGPALSAKLDSPRGIAVDAAGNVYISDTGNVRVRVLFPSGSSSCTYSVDSQTLGAATAGGSVTVRVTTGSECTWTASSSGNWVTSTGASSGTGTGTVTFTAAANTSSSTRTAVLTVAGQPVYVNQAGSGQTLSSLISVPGGSVVNTASGAVAIASGSFISIFGQNLADTRADWNSSISDGVTLPTQLGGVRVRVNGKDCYIHYVSPGQINALTPPDTVTGQVLVEISTIHGTAASVVQLNQASPAWFTYPAQGSTYIAALTLPDYLLVAPVNALPGTPSRPAKAGEYVQLYANGLGGTNPQCPAGKVLTSAYPIADLAQVQVTVGGLPAHVEYSGLVAAGLFQVNIRIPDGVAAGNQPVTLTVGGRPAQLTAVLALTR